MRSISAVIDPDDELHALEDAVRAELAGAADARQASAVVVERLFEPGRRLVSVYLLERDRMRCQAARGYWQILDGIPRDVGVIGRTARTGERAVVHDVSGEHDYLEASPAVRAEVCVPLHVGGKLLGALNVESPEPIGPTGILAADMCAAALADRLTALAVAPTESRARRLARHATRLTTLSTFEGLGAAIVEAAVDVSGMSSACLVPGRTLTGTAATGPLGDALLALAPEDLRAVAGWVAGGSTCYTAGDPTGIGFAGHDALRRAGANAVICVPLAQDESSGLLIVADDAGHAVSADRAQILELLAAHAAACLRTEAALADLRDRAARDPLTGLGHHGSFHRALEVAAEAYAPLRVAVLLIDLDDFKAVNDRDGHGAGDEMLRTAAAVLTDAVRRHDRVFRVGGDEFAAIVPVEDRSATEALARRVHAAGGTLHGVTFSVGVAMLEPGESAEAAVARADRALYDVKRAGRNHIAVAWEDAEGRNRTCHG